MKKLLRRTLVEAMRFGFRITGETGRRLTAEALAQGNEPLLEVVERVSTSRGPITFYCLGDLALFRARTLLTKEPETIEWIDTFEDGEVLWDIGANVGVYSLYAAASRKVKVLAFEPAAGNYLLLNRNIEINRLDDCIQAFCLAFADQTRADVLNMQSSGFGSALASFAEAKDFNDRPFTPSFRQTVLGFTIDGLLAQFQLPFPNHLKIDVDGIEDRIVAGAKRTLADHRLKSISVELEANRVDNTNAVLAQLDAAGFRTCLKASCRDVRRRPIRPHIQLPVAAPPRTRRSSHRRTEIDKWVESIASLVNAG